MIVSMRSSEHRCRPVDDIKGEKYTVVWYDEVADVDFSDIEWRIASAHYGPNPPVGPSHFDTIEEDRGER